MSKPESQVVVEQFLEALSALDMDAAMDLIDEDCVYQNMPYHKVTGAKAIRGTLNGMAKAMNLFEVEMLNMVANDHVVMTERIDTLGSKLFKAEVPLMGVFVVYNGKITEWRDYFDWPQSFGRFLRGMLLKPFGG